MRRILAAVCGAVCLVTVVGCQADVPSNTSAPATPGTTLKFLELPILLKCGADERAFFRASVNPVDEKGLPTAIPFRPTKEDPGGGFRVSEASRKEPHTVLLVSQQASQETGRKGNSILLLLDTSGSMLNKMRTGGDRYTAAIGAIKNALRTLKAGDNIAIAPFDSHDVAGRITRAEFQSTSEDLIRQINGLRRPEPKNNTALYSAVAAALPKLQKRRDADHAVALVVLSDGENLLTPPNADDDRDLLDGKKAFADLRTQIKDAGITIFTVGFGVLNKTLVGELEGLAYPNEQNYSDASEGPGKLTEILESIRNRQSQQYQLLFGPVRNLRTNLNGSSLTFQVGFDGSGQRIPAAEGAWSAPGASTAVPQAKCSEAELAAVETYAPGDKTGISSWPDILLVFAGFAAVLAGLWFAAPRFAWPESYIPRPVIPQASIPTLPGGVQVQQAPQPQVPTWDRVRGSGAPPTPPMPPSGPSRGRAPQPPPPEGTFSGEQTIVIPGPSTQNPPRRRPASPADTDRRSSGDETVYMPPPKDPYSADANATPWLMTRLI